MTQNWNKGKELYSLTINMITQNLQVVRQQKQKLRAKKII